MITHQKIETPRRSTNGYALLTTLVFLAIMLGLLASITELTTTQSGLTSRNNLYNSAVAAAEGASEMAISKMDRDFINQSVNGNLNVYRVITPASVQSGWPLQFGYSNGSGVADATGVLNLGPAVMTNLNSQFAGLYGLATPYRITSTASPLNRQYNLSATVSQDIQLASIPVFQFAIFYSIDLELNPGANMTVTGKVHGNADIYTAPGATLTYKDAVTSVGRIYNDRMVNDPQYGSAKTVPVYQANHTEKVGALILPVGTDNDPASVQEILKTPISGGDTNLNLAKERYYNKADLIVTTTSTGVSVTSGAWNLFNPITPDVTNAGIPGYSFISTTNSIYDAREKKWSTTTQINVGKLNTWLTNNTAGAPINTSAVSTEGHGINSIYVDDQRSSPLTTVEVVNGAKLPSDGLTVATQLPLYVQGHYNLNNGDTSVGQTATSQTKPASLVGDSITILSQNWNDGKSGLSLANRTPTDTTVNAAILAGIVKTTKQGSTKYYSGGAENFIRLLEDWGGRNLTYNGSMVVMFESRFATNFWQNTGNYYNAPARRWAFDINFLDQTKLPPGTPQVRKLVRGQWAILNSP